MIAKTTRIVALALSTFLTSVLFSNSVTAEELSPYAALEITGDKLFSRISDNKQELEKFPEIMRTIIEEELMPMIDYKYAAYKILGSNLRHTTAEQRENFADSMRTYLVRTYATALNSYNNQEVIYERERSFADKKIISVGTKIVEENKPDINIAFMMRKNSKTQEWKVYDMVVEGISLLSSKQSELNQRISKQGIEQVTLELASIAK